MIRYLEQGEAHGGRPGWYRAEGPIALGGSVYFSHSFNLEPTRVE